MGFSSGALAPHAPREAIRRSVEIGATAIELSALRLHELELVADAVGVQDLAAFAWVSVHAPSRFGPEEEKSVAARLRDISKDSLPIILHPDTIHDPDHWRAFGNRLVLENMDRRKAGRFAEEFHRWFDVLPDARLCLDVAHVRQVDPSFVEGYRFVQAFGDRIVEIHISEVDSASRHDRLSLHAQFHLRDFLTLLPDVTPVIIESKLERTTAEKELDVVRGLFSAVEMR